MSRATLRGRSTGVANGSLPALPQTAPLGTMITSGRSGREALFPIAVASFSNSPPASASCVSTPAAGPASIAAQKSSTEPTIPGTNPILRATRQIKSRSRAFVASTRMVSPPMLPPATPAVFIQLVRYL